MGTTNGNTTHEAIPVDKALANVAAANGRTGQQLMAPVQPDTAVNSKERDIVDGCIEEGKRIAAAIPQELPAPRHMRRRSPRRFLNLIIGG